MRDPSTTRRSATAALLRLLVVAAFLALFVPALALGEDGVALVDPPAAEQPASEAPAAPAEEPVTQEPAPAQEAPAAPPPASEAPSAPPGPAEPSPAPGPTSEAPVGTAPLVPPVVEPVLAPTLPELAPVLSGTIPDDPAARPVVAVVAPTPDAVPVPRLAALAALAAAPPPAPTAAIAPVPGLSVALGDPAKPVELAPVAAPEAPVVPAAAAMKDFAFAGPALTDAFEPAASASPAAPANRPAVVGTEAHGPAPFAGPRLVAPEGNAPPGSSLLEVLAGYVLPGSSGPPASSIIFLVLLGTLLAAVYARRPQVSEPIHLLGLLGPRSGHGLAVRRPG